MKKVLFHRKLATALAAVAFLAAGSFAGNAHAVVFDFGTIGGIGGNEQANPNEVDATPIGLRFLEGSNSVFLDGFDGGESGLQVIATGQNVGAADADEEINPFAYLDGLSNSRPAGLGVCQILNVNQCNPSSDDNITGPGDPEDPTEQLTLTFNDSVVFVDASFRSENHWGVDETGELVGTDTLIINGIATTFAGAQGTLMGIGPATTFTFQFGGDYAEQFYVSGATVRRSVPEPATLGILGLGIVMLGVVGRRRRAS